MNVINSFNEDAVFSHFVNDDYDPECYANNIIAASTVTQSLQGLKEGVDKLDLALEQHVSEHYEDLINQATGMDILDESLALVKGRVDQLQRSMSSIRKRLTEPYNQINTRTQQLARLQKTCDVLRRVTRIQYLSKRLKQQLEGGIKEITKTSQTCNELQYLYGDGDLEGIDVIDNDIEWITQARKNIQVQAGNLLTQGLASLNQNQTSTALQVFHSIGNLRSIVSNSITTKCTYMRTELKSALVGSSEQNYSGMAPGGTNLGNTSAWRAGLWTSLDKWSNTVTNNYNQIHVLHRTLVRRRDPSSHKTLLDECELCPIEMYVADVHLALQEELRNVSSGTKHALDIEYPKALRLVLGLWDHFNTKLGVEGLADVTLPDVNIREVLTTHQCTYLARSLNRLLDPVNIAFPGKSVPTTNEMESILRIMMSELAAARGDDQLRRQSVNNIVKTVRDVLNKCESLVHHGNVINDVTSAPNEYHHKNIQVINVLCTMYTKLQDMAVEPLAGVIREVWSIISDILNTLLAPFRTQIEFVFNTIHHTNYGMDKQDISGCSAYIALVEEAINHLTNDFISLITTKSAIQPKLLEFQDSLLSVYLHHLCVVRPLGEGGKMKLATDIAEMERVFAPLLEKEIVCEQFKTLRSFRAVLFLSVVDIATVQNVPKSILLNYLFSRAGDAMLSPYKVAGWTVVQYVSWMYSHTNEILDMVHGTIQWYEDMIRESGALEYDPIYPVLLNMLKS